MVYPLYYCATIARRLVVARIICPWITSGEIALHKMHGPLITTTTTTTTTSFQVSHRNIRSIINERSAYRCIRRWADNKLPGRLSMLSFFSFPTLLPPPHKSFSVLLRAPKNTQSGIHHTCPLPVRLYYVGAMHVLHVVWDVNSRFTTVTAAAHGKLPWSYSTRCVSPR